MERNALMLAIASIVSTMTKKNLRAKKNCFLLLNKMYKEINNN